VLHSFGADSSDGTNPSGSLIMDKEGNLYGTTSGGGANADCTLNGGCGTVYKLTPAGKENVLYSFGGYPVDGSSPEAGLALDDKGNLYGTTSNGGNEICYNETCGTAFELSPARKETVLYNFGNSSDGQNPWSSLILDSKGDLYGTTYYGGKNCGIPCIGSGVVFKITP